VTMACAVSLADIRSVWISDGAGGVVLHGSVGVPAAPGTARSWPAPGPPATGTYAVGGVS